MKSATFLLVFVFATTNIFAKEIIINLPVKTPRNGWSAYKIIKLDHLNGRATLIDRSGHMSIALESNSLSYFAFSYINDYEPPRIMRSFNFPNEKSLQDIVKYSSLASKNCPFGLDVTDYGEVKSYRIPECLQ